MDYNGLKSVVFSGKTSFQMRVPTDSFYISDKPTRPYIEPTLKKVEYNHVRPNVFLISAVGATGKTILAQMLSSETKLPLLDLAKHKPVGDNTLTGLLTSAYKVEDLSNVFQAIKGGKYGVIIDGIDEGRSKTTEKAFEAFLDDIVQLCEAESNTNFVLLGRTQALDDCWLYLTEKGLRTDLVSIAPFSLQDARRYIDVFTGGLNSRFKDQYIEARDYVLKTLSKAFLGKSAPDGTDFLSFIGYPPVLESIVTLLTKEKNYYKLMEQIKGPEGDGVEVSLLRRIAVYILEREKSQKVIPNILDPLLSDRPAPLQDSIKKGSFTIEEQCMRLIAFSLGKRLTMQSIAEQVINEKYEAQLVTFLPEHPFLNGRQFRNAVFESLSLAVLLTTADPKCAELIHEYVASHKHNYHLVFLLDNLLSGKLIQPQYLSIIIGSALEFQSPTSSVELTIEEVVTKPLGQMGNQSVVDIEIEIIFNNEKTKSFLFRSNLNEVESIHLGNRLSSAFIAVPCDITIGAGPETDFTAPIHISGKVITINSANLILRHPHSGLDEDRLIVIEASRLVSRLERITTNDLAPIFAVENRSGIAYPVIKYIQERIMLPNDPSLNEKYSRLKRIFMEFRSHSRGSLARYKEKIENERVLRNELGEKILSRLLRDGVLQLKDKFYFLNPEAVDKFLGVSWLGLRRGETDKKLIQYLQSIN